MKELERKVDEAEKECEEKMKANIKDLEIMNFDVSEFIQTKRELLEYVSYLTTEASDAELIFREQQYPKYTSSKCTDFVTINDVEFAVLRNINKLEEQLDMLHDIELVSFRNKPPYSKPLKN